MRGFSFKAPIDPRNPLDRSDLPPEGWDTEIDTSDFRRALFGFRSTLYQECLDWEVRELGRYEKKGLLVSSG